MALDPEDFKNYLKDVDLELYFRSGATELNNLKMLMSMFLTTSLKDMEFVCTEEFTSVDRLPEKTLKVLRVKFYKK